MSRQRLVLEKELVRQKTNVVSVLIGEQDDEKHFISGDPRRVCILVDPAGFTVGFSASGGAWLYYRAA
ncbi:hypothetical protein RIV07_01445 [Pseudomonas baetica]|nr:hypothetical protein [Pseudomonas baetica]